MDKEQTEEEVVVKDNVEPEDKPRGSLLSALGVLSPAELDKINKDDDNDVTDVVEDAPAVAEEPIAEEKQSDDTPSEEPKSEDDVLPDGIVDEQPAEKPDSVEISAKGIRVKRKAKKVEPAPEPVKEPDPEPEPEPEPQSFSHLSKREQDTIALVEFGEKNGKADKGVADKVIKYYEDRKALIEKLQADNFDDDDYDISSDRELARWKRQNPPPIDPDSLDEIRQEKLIQLAEERVTARLKPESERARKELEEYKRSVEVERVKPVVEGKVASFSDKVLKGMPEEVTSVLSKGGDWEAVKGDLPIEAPIVERVLNKYADQAESFLSVVEGVTRPDMSDPIQNEVRQFMFSQADLLISKGKTLRGGKQFVHPAKFSGEDGTWTFSSDHVLQMLEKKAQNVAKREIKLEQRRIDAIIQRRAAPVSTPKGDDRAPASTSVKSSPAGKPAGTPPSGGGGIASLLGI